MADLSQIAKAIQKVAAATPGIISGTVSGPSEGGQIQVILDSDPSRKSVSALSLIGTGAVTGSRVLMIRYPPRGLVVLGFLNLPTPVVTRQYLVSGTWTKPEGIRGVWVELQAAGGGSGGTTTTPANQTSGSGGGQGGGYAKFWVPAADLPASVAVTVGFGGTGGAAGGGNGGVGGASSFGTLGSMPGGAGGAGGGAAAFAGGATSQAGGTGNQLFTGSVGAANAIVLPGSDGGTGIRVAASPTAIPGAGGASFLSGTKEPQPITGTGTNTNQIAGSIGQFPGGGGSGPAGMGTAGVTQQAGGFGADGTVYITEIYY